VLPRVSSTAVTSCAKTPRHFCLRHRLTSPFLIGYIFFGTVNQGTTGADCWCGNQLAYVTRYEALSSKLLPHAKADVID